MLSEELEMFRNTNEGLLMTFLFPHLQKGSVNCAGKAANGFRKTPTNLLSIKTKKKPRTTTTKKKHGILRKHSFWLPVSVILPRILIWPNIWFILLDTEKFTHWVVYFNYIPYHYAFVLFLTSWPWESDLILQQWSHGFLNRVISKDSLHIWIYHKSQTMKSTGTLKRIN